MFEMIKKREKYNIKNFEEFLKFKKIIVETNENKLDINNLIHFLEKENIEKNTLDIIIKEIIDITHDTKIIIWGNISRIKLSDTFILKYFDELNENSRSLGLQYLEHLEENTLTKILRDSKKEYDYKHNIPKIDLSDKDNFILQNLENLHLPFVIQYSKNLKENTLKKIIDFMK